MKVGTKKQIKEKERVCMQNVKINPFVDNNHTSTNNTNHYKKERKLFYSYSTSNLKQLQDLKQSQSLYNDLHSIREKANHDEIDNLLKTSNHGKKNFCFPLETINNIVYKHRNKKGLPFLYDKEKQDIIHKNKQSNIVQNRQRLNKYIDEIENRVLTYTNANIHSIRNLRSNYNDNIRRQREHAYWQRWKARKSGFGHFSPTQKRKPNKVRKPRFSRNTSLI